MKKHTIRYKIISLLKDIDIVGVRTIAQHLPKMIIPKAKNLLTVKTLYGFLMEIDPVQDNGLERSIYYTGTYEKGTLHIIKNVLNEGDVFIDVGANIGLMSILAAFCVKSKGKVFAFEPNPKTYEILAKNILLNSLDNIETSKLALGNEPKKSKIYDRWNSNRGSASLIKPDYETDSYDIEVTTIDNYFSDIENPVDLIKFDIEGYELEALKGSKKILEKTFPMLIIECSENRANLDNFEKSQLYDFLNAFNKYKIFKLSRGKERVSKLIEITSTLEMPQHDNIFCFTEEHLKKIPASIFKS